jgi:hypothetical protein
MGKGQRIPLMRKDTRFRRPDRSEIEEKLSKHILADPQALGVWNMMLRGDDPSDVAHTYRSFRDSKHCTVPREHLREMRDAMITSMREANKKDPKPRKEKKKGKHYDAMPDGWMPRRTGA